MFIINYISNFSTLPKLGIENENSIKLKHHQVNNNLDYFSIGSKYQLSLSPSSPDSYEIVDKFRIENVKCEQNNSIHLPAIWDTATKSKVPIKIPITETVIRISSASSTLSENRNCNKRKLCKRSNLYERKKWQSQENFDLTSITMDNNDTCFSGDEEVTF